MKPLLAALAVLLALTLASCGAAPSHIEEGRYVTSWAELGSGFNYAHVRTPNGREADCIVYYDYDGLAIDCEWSPEDRP